MAHKRPIETSENIGPARRRNKSGQLPERQKEKLHPRRKHKSGPMGQKYSEDSGISSDGKENITISINISPSGVKGIPLSWQICRQRRVEHNVNLPLSEANDPAPAGTDVDPCLTETKPKTLDPRVCIPATGIYLSRFTVHPVTKRPSVTFNLPGGSLTSSGFSQDDSIDSTVDQPIPFHVATLPLHTRGILHQRNKSDGFLSLKQQDSNRPMQIIDDPRRGLIPVHSICSLNSTSSSSICSLGIGHDGFSSDSEYENTWHGWTGPKLDTHCEDCVLNNEAVQEKLSPLVELISKPEFLSSLSENDCRVEIDLVEDSTETRMVKINDFCGMQPEDN